MVDIGEKIKLLRKAKKISQEQLAEELEVSIQQLYKYESGKNRIPIEKLIILADKFNVDLNYFADVEFKPNALILTSEEQELIKIYRNIQTEKLRKSWITIGLELSKYHS